MTLPVRWGILSTAAINDPVLKGCAGSSSVQFTAVASRDPERARAWAAERQIPKSFASYSDLLDDPEVDAIYISLPNSLHLQWAIRAIRAGKHVLCEKPLGRDPGQVAEAFSEARRANRLLVEAFMYRFHPQTDKIRGLIADGAIGVPKHLRATLSFSMAAPSADVRNSIELEGGALMDVGCYCVSGFRLFFGEPVFVEGYGVGEGSAVDSRFLGLLVNENGMTGQFDCGMTLPRRDAMEIVGDEGVIFVPDPWHCRGAPVQLESKDRRTAISVPKADAYRSEFEAVSRAIRGGTKVEFTDRDAIAQAAVLQALHRSAEGKMRDVAPVERPDTTDGREECGSSSSALQSHARRH